MAMSNTYRFRVRILSAYILSAAAVFGFAGPAFSQVESASGADAAPKSSQPADFRTSRFEIRDDYYDLHGVGTVYMIVPRVDFAVDRDLSFRIETPMVFADPGAPNNATESGIGDLLFRGSYAVTRGPGYTIVAGSELILDTARKDLLGMGKNVIAPLVYASIDVPQYDSVVFPFLQHYVTLDGDNARPDVHYTSIKSAFLTRWRNLTYTIVEPQVVVDHERADKVGMTLEGEAGHFVNRTTAIWVRPGVGLFGDNLPQVYNWKFEVGIRFFLK